MTADPVRREQIVGTLVGNAVEHPPPGGRVEVAAVRNGEEVGCVVSDTGVGDRPLGSGGMSAAWFVLVHGMSHGAWCWDLLRDRLERRGHRVLAVDLPGHGRRAHEWRRASVEAYAAAVADAMALAGVHRAVVVGHSMAGIVIPKVAERAAARVAHLVFLAAVVVPHGSSLLETHRPAPSRSLFRGLAAGGGGLVQYPAEVAHARWMNDLPAGDARLGAALIRLTPQPLRPWTERLDLRRFYAMTVPRTYIRCLRDVAVPAARAAEYAARLGVRPVDLDSDHVPMLSHPDDLARLLEQVAAGPPAAAHPERER